MNDRMKYVMLFRGEQEAAAAAATRVEAMPGVVVLRRSGAGLLLVECAGDVDFLARAQETGNWTVSEQRSYHLL